MSKCILCPRRCGRDRENGELGACHVGAEILVARAAPHLFEEPPISGTRGSGAIFFCGCNLHCVFCQNKTISIGGGYRRVLSESELEALIFKLRDLGAHNINLVTPTHFADTVARVLEAVKPSLDIPVVYNTSGYEKVETLRMLDGLVDVYLPDFKYASGELAALYSSAPDYTEVAAAALCEMHRQVGRVTFDGEGLIRRGVIVRHLVLPSHRRDSIAVLEKIAELLPIDEIRLSLMSQYTPDFALDTEFKCLHRRVTSFEYSSVLERALSLGFDGYFQERTSATDRFTPSFDDGDILKSI